jgi:selenocysteine-specific elongation factor
MVVISKADLVDPELMELAELEIHDAVQHTVFSGKPVIRFSATGSSGKEKLLSCIKQAIEEMPGKNPDAAFRMWIDEAIGAPGFGTVACGTILSGVLSQDDPLCLLPLCRETRARSLEVHHRKAATAFAGQRVGINLPKISLKEVRRGMVLVKQKPENLFVFLNAELTADATIKNLQRVKLYLGTSVFNARVTLMDQPLLSSGQIGLVQFRLNKPLFAVPRDPFVICGMNTQTVIGGGLILEAAKEKFRAAKSSRMIPYLQALRSGDLRMTIQYYLRNHSRRLVDRNELSEYTGFSSQIIRREISELINEGEIISCDNKTVLLKETYAALTMKIQQAVDAFLLTDPLKKAVGRDEIRKAVDLPVDDALLKYMLDDLYRLNRIVKVKGGYIVAGFAVVLNPAQQKMADILMHYAWESGLSSFSAGNYCKVINHDFKKNGTQKILEFLHEQGKLIRLNNNNFLNADVLEDIKRRVKQAIDEKGSICMSDSQDILGYGRSKAAPVFEYLDEIGFTCRQGDERRLADNQ